MNIIRNIVLCSLLYALCFAPGFSQPGIQPKAAESLKRIFGDSVTVSAPQIIHLTSEEQRLLFEQTKTIQKRDSIGVYVCTSHNQTIGYGFVDNVKGKTQLITYLVALTPTGETVDVDVLAYRESYGGEIAYESFRKQFRGKSAADKLKPGKDIKNISGATISVRAITDGIKAILKTFEIIKPHLN